MSYFEPTCNNSSDLASKFLKRVRFRISLFNTRHNLNGNNYKASDFEGKNFVENQQFLKSLLSKEISLCHFTLWKQQSWHFRFFSQVLILKIFCEMEYIFSIKFFEQLDILIKFLKTSEILDQDVWTYRFLSNHFKICQHFNWKFKNVSHNQV